MKSKCTCSKVVDSWKQCPIHYILDIYNFGDFRMGLTEQELTQYLKARNTGSGIRNVTRKFSELAGCNTMGVHQCSYCGKQFGLMYRSDVKRFADLLFDRKPTHWD